MGNNISDERRLLANIQDSLINLKEDIYNFFHTTDAQWAKLTKKVSDPTRERIWTFLIACGYALGGLLGVEKLTELLAGIELEQPMNPKIWLEAIPISPRSGRDEGKTHLDLALGAIAKRDKTENGIMLDSQSSLWVCFCESKIDSDIAPNVTYDSSRNQLIRIIENAICFQNDGTYTDKVFVTIITPREAFINKRPLLEEKFGQYNSDPKLILEEIQNCTLVKNSYNNWKYPENLNQRIESLSLRRVYFEDLVYNMPETKVSGRIKGLWNKLGM